MQRPTPFPQVPSAAPHRLAHGRLSLMEVVGQSFSIGPLIDVALFLAFVSATAGPDGPLAILLAAVSMIAFSLIVAFYAAETGGAGAIGDYIARVWGATAGRGTLGIYVLSLVFSGAAGFSIAVGVLVSQFLELYCGWHFPWWVASFGISFLAWFLNIRGVAAATRVQFGIIAVSVIPFLLTAVAAIIHAGSANTIAVFCWWVPGGGNLFGALLFSVLLFGGFETAASLGEETGNPRRNISIALVGSVSAAAVLLVLCSYAGTVYFGPKDVAKVWGGSIDAFAKMAGVLLGPWAALWIRLAVLVDFAATCLGFTVAASRGIYSLSREGSLPAPLSRTNKRGAPAAATTMVFAVALITLVGGMFVPAADRYHTLFVAATGQALLLVIVYLALAAGALRLLWMRRGEQPWWRWPIFIVGSLAPALALYGTLVPLPDFPEMYGLLGALGALALVAIWLTLPTFCVDRKASSGASTHNEADKATSEVL